MRPERKRKLLGWALLVSGLLVLGMCLQAGFGLVLVRLLFVYGFLLMTSPIATHMKILATQWKKTIADVVVARLAPPITCWNLVSARINGGAMKHIVPSGGDTGVVPSASKTCAVMFCGGASHMPPSAPLGSRSVPVTA